MLIILRTNTLKIISIISPTIHILLTIITTFITTLEMNNIVFRLPSSTNLFHFLHVLYKFMTTLEMNNIVFRLPSLTNLFHFLHALYKFITTLEMNNIVFRLLSLTNLFHFLHVLYDCVLWSSRRYQYIYSNLYLINCIQKIRFKFGGAIKKQ